MSMMAAAPGGRSGVEVFGEEAVEMLARFYAAHPAYRLHRILRIVGKEHRRFLHPEAVDEIAESFASDSLEVGAEESGRFPGGFADRLCRYSGLKE